MRPEMDRPRPCDEHDAGADTEAFAGNRYPHNITTAARVQRLAERLHSLGPRVLLEFILALAADPGADVLDHLERYAEIKPEDLHQAWGDRFPPRPLWSPS